MRDFMYSQQSCNQDNSRQNEVRSKIAPRLAINRINLYNTTTGNVNNIYSVDTSGHGGIQEMSTSFVFPMNFPSMNLSSRVDLIAN